MKKATMLCLIVISAVSLAAAQDVRFSAGPHAGIAISSFEQDWKDYYGIGYGGGAHFDADIARFFSARLDIEYYTFASDKTKLKPVVAAFFGLQPTSIASLSGGNIGAFIIALEGIGKIPTQSPVTPYALFGVGIHSLSLSDLSGSDTQGRTASATSDDVKFDGGTKLGLDFGIGMEYKVNRAVSLALEFRYVLVFTANNTNAAMPVTVGANFHF